MEVIYKDQFNTLVYDKESALTHHTWLESSEDMTDEEFKKVVEIWQKTVLDNQVKFHLLDTRNFRFMVNPDIQDWMAVKMVAPCVEAGLQKMATILPDGDIFAQASTEQSMDENKEQGGLESNIFTNIEDAKEWLFS